MAIAVRTHSHHVTPRPPWMRRQQPGHDGLLAAFMVMLVFVSITILLLFMPSLTVTVPRSLTGATQRSVEARPRDGASSAADRSSVADAEEPALEPPGPVAEIVAEADHPPVAELVVGGRARVVNTAGVGVILHAAPRAGARRPAGLLEGTTVTVVEPPEGEWVRVQSDTKAQGWVPSAYLDPAD